MNPYRTNSYDPGVATSLPSFWRRRVPNWMSAIVVGVCIVLSAFPVYATPTPSLRINGVKYPDNTNSPSGVFNLKMPECGAVADGVTDDTAAIQACENLAAVKGGTVYWPSSNGERYTITSTITVSSIYPVNNIGDMNGFADNQQTGAFIRPGANFGSTPMIKYVAPGGSHGAHGGGLIRGLAFYDNFDGTHTPHYTMSMALDLQDFNLGRIENCYFHVLNGGAIRSIFWIMGSMRNVVIRYCGVAAGQAALSLESASASITAQSVTIDNVKLEVEYSTYLKIDSNVIQVKFSQLGFEADTSNALTCQTFIDNSGQQIQFNNIHINRNTVTQWVNQAASNFTIADNISIYGNSSLTVASMTIGGSNHIFRGITIRNLTAQATQAISITGAFVDLSDVNIGNSGGIAASGNSYVSIKNVLVNAPVAIASGAVIDASDQFAHIEGVILVSVPANMNGIRLGGAGGANCRQSSVINNEVRDTSGTGVAFVNNDTNGSTVWTANRAFSNTADWSSLGTNYVAIGNLWTGPSSLQRGTVTQITSITTGVTVNTPSGVITTFSAATAAQATSTFTVTNSSVTSAAEINVSLGAYSGTLGTNGTPIVTVSSVGTGTFNVTIYNAHAANALAGTLKINYSVL